jgi:tetratricopeptide (TPR) repeat protein
LLFVTGTAVLALHGLTLAAWPVPGISAYLTSLHLGLESQPVIGHLLYRTTLAWVAGWPWGTLGLRVNVMAWVCTGLGLSIFHHLVFHFYSITNLVLRRRIRAWCAALATWMAATSLPVWWAGSRASPFSFNFLLAMAVFWLLAAYLRKRQIAYLFGFSLAYGVVAIEYPALLLLAPLAGILGLMLLYRHKQLTVRRVMYCALLGAAGLASSGLTAAVFLNSPGAEGSGIGTWFEAFRALWLGLIRAALHGVPTTGWLLVLMVSVIPFIGCLWSAFCSPDTWAERRNSFAIVNTILLIAVMAGLMDTPLSPWRVFGDGHIMILPCLLMGAVIGYVFGFAYLFPQDMWNIRPSTVKIIRGVLVAIAAVVVLLPLIHFNELDPRGRKGLWSYAGEVIASLDQRDALLVQDHDAYLVRLAALEKKSDLVLLLPSEENNPFYRRTIERAFPDPHLQALGKLSLMSVLKEILMRRPEMVDRLAFVGNPALFSAHNYTAVPSGLVYVGVRDTSILNPEALVENHQARQTSLLPALRRVELQKGMHQESAQAKRWYVSRLANDLGVLMQYLQRDDLAATCYQLAREANEKNASALLNLAVLKEGTGHEGALWTEAANLLEHARFPLAQLVVLFGHIRSPDALVFLKNLWTVPVAPPSEVSAEPALGEVYALFSRGDYEAALAKTDALIKAHPASPRTWWMRGLLAEKLGRDDLWTLCWQRMDQMQQEWPMFLMIEGRRRLAAGDREGARALLIRAAVLWPDNTGLLEIVAQLEFDDKNYAQARMALRRLLALDPAHEGGLRLLAALEQQKDSR